MQALWDRSAFLAGVVILLAGLSWAAAPSFGAGKEGGPKVKEGQKAPDVELPATQIGTVLPEKKDAKTLRLRDFQGKKNVVLWFFPKALTGG